MNNTTSVFQERAVAFLDILGFSDFMKQAEQQPAYLSSLFGLRTTLDAHVHFDNTTLATSVPDEMKPRYIFISDSIILSVPLRHGQYDGLAIVIIKAIEIAHKLLEMGHLLRGGVAVGSVWHDDSNIFGTGYIDAVNAEKTANHPRIILTDDATKHWNNNKLLDIPLSEFELCMKDNDDRIIVNTLHPEYIRSLETHGREEDAFKQYRAYISTRLQELPPGSSARSKWEWIAAFFNRAVKQHNVNVPIFKDFQFPQP